MFEYYRGGERTTRQQQRAIRIPTAANHYDSDNEAGSIGNYLENSERFRCSLLRRRVRRKIGVQRLHPMEESSARSSGRIALPLACWMIVILFGSSPLFLSTGMAAAAFVGRHNSHDGITKVRNSGRFRAAFSKHFVVATTTADTTTVTNNAVDLCYTDFCPALDGGEQEAPAPPVVLLHGLLGSKRNFATVATSLANQLERKRRIVAVDLRNHGDNTDDWRDEMTYRDMAGDVLAFLDGQGMDRAVLVGHSMGGKVAQAVALLAPHRVDGLVVLDIAPVKYTTADAPWKAVRDIIHFMHTKVDLDDGDESSGSSITKRQVDEVLRPAVPDPALRAFLLTNLDFRGARGPGQSPRWKIYLDGIYNQLEHLADFNIVDDAAEQQRQRLTYEGDTYFIHGGQSRFVRHAYMETIANYFPNHMLTTVKASGHWVHAEAPEDTTALLKRYLDR